MTPQQITEAQRLATLLDESRVSVPRMHAHEAAEFLRTLAAQAAQERPAAWRFRASGQEWHYAESRQGWADDSIEQQPLYARPVTAIDVEALKRAGESAAMAMSLLTPPGICADAHHAKADRHGIGERCPVADRYIAAYHALRAALEGLK